jgi:hypothetical protein
MDFAFFAIFSEQEKTEGTESCFKLSTPPFPLLPLLTPVPMVLSDAACRAVSWRLPVRHSLAAADALNFSLLPAWFRLRACLIYSKQPTTED